MKPKKILHPLFLLALLVVAGGFSAKAQENITLRLRTMLNYYPVQCDSIVVQNNTQGTSTTLYYPDTVLTNWNVGIEEFVSGSGKLKLALLSANPFADKAEILLTLPQSGNVELAMFNMLGQQEFQQNVTLSKGQHRFSVRTGGNGLHILTVRTATDQCNVKLIQHGGENGCATISHIGTSDSDFPEKNLIPTRSQFDFAVGDHLTLTTYANAHYYDTITPIQQTVGLTVSESGTVNFKSFRTFEPDSILNKDSINLRNTIWDVVASAFTSTAYNDYYTCLYDFATDMGEEVESQVTFYDSTFCSVRRAGICDAEYYLGQYHMGSTWYFNYFPYQQEYFGKYRLEYRYYPEYNYVVADLYVGPMDSLCSNLDYHYRIHYEYDYNILWVGDETHGMDATWHYYSCYFRREGENRELPVSDVHFSGCLGKNIRNDSINFQFEDHLLNVHHLLNLNCAASSVIVHSGIHGNTIDISYLVDDNISANCFCPTELDYMVHDIPSGTYNVVIRLDGRIIYQQYHSF